MDNTTVVTAQYGTVITTVGSAKIAACILNGTKLNVTHAAVGDGGGVYYKPTPEQTALVNECWRGEIAYARVSETTPNMIDVKFIVPAEVGGFTVREASLVDADGDTIAICNTPDAQKIPITDGVSFPLTMVMHIIVTDASVVTFSINPSLDTASLTSIDFVIPVEAWALDEAAQDEYAYYADARNDAIASYHRPHVTLDKPSRRVARACGVAPFVDTPEAGKLRFYAVLVPKAEISGRCDLWMEGGSCAGGGGYTLPVATETTLGGVKIPANSGLKVDAEGNLSADTPTTEESADALDEIFGGEEAPAE